MDGVKISEIPFALVNQKEQNGYTDEYWIKGYNQAIIDQGQVRLSLSRENLAEALFKNSRKLLISLSPKSEYIVMKNGDKLIPNWNESHKETKDSFRVQADFLIEKQKDLFVVVK